MTLRELDANICLDQNYRPNEISLSDDESRLIDNDTSRWGMLGYSKEGKKLYHTSKVNTLNKFNVSLNEIKPGNHICKIPKKLHLCWVGDKNPPSYFYTSLDSWKNLLSDDWEIIIWDNEKLTTDYFEKDYLDLIESSKYGAQKKDLIQWYVLDKLGGFFADVDFIPYRNLDDLFILDADVMVCHDIPFTFQYMANAFIGSIPKSDLIGNILECIQTDGISDQVHMTTGPGILGKCIWNIYQDSNIKPFANLESLFFYKSNVDALLSYVNYDEGKWDPLYQPSPDGIFADHTYGGTWVDKNDAYLNFKFEPNCNFGDAINCRFWKEITGREITSDYREPYYLTTGSIMGKATDNAIIFGTGFISENDDLGGNHYWDKETTSSRECTPKKVLAVRGPLTRRKLIKMGIDCPEVYGDPLLLLPSLYGNLKTGERGKIGILPHIDDKGSATINILKKNLLGYNVKELDIQIGTDWEDALKGNFDYESLINDILDCEYIISSTLHGVMMGLIYGKKTIYLKFSDNVIGGDFKFNDFFYSIGVNYNRIQDFSKDVLNNVIPVDYTKIQSTAINLLYHCPFIDNERKIKLTQNLLNFYGNEKTNR